MQRYVHRYRNASNIFNMLESLLAYTSDDTSKDFDDVIWLDDTFKALCDILYDNLIWFRMPKFIEIPLPEIENVANNEKEVIVCTSGGKDSTAVALSYKNAGYNVYLYHSRGINRSYFDEYLACKRVADYLKLPLYVEQVSIEGTGPFVEHPLKNYMIACGAIHFALANHITPRIALGNFRNSHIDTSPFDVSGGDCIEMWEAFNPIIRRVIPSFPDVQIPLLDNSQTFEILTKNWELFEKTISCMSPYRFRDYWRHRTEQRYNVQLMENRCGACWKCSIEYIWLMDHDKVEHNQNFYLHCVRILAKTVQKEMGLEVSSPEDIWENYMFYPMTESKEYEILSNSYFKYFPVSNGNKPDLVDCNTGVKYGVTNSANTTKVGDKQRVDEGKIHRPTLFNIGHR